jgi:hypothetical protein
MEHQYKKEQLKKYKSDVHQLNRDVDQVSMAINGFLRATLLISGFHPHKGQWRRIRYE